MDNTTFVYLDRLRADLIEQFRDQPNIEILNKVLAKQLQEVYDFFLQLRTVLEIDSCYGQQLDNIGSIVQLTRKEAADLARQSSYTYADEDDMYRVFLYYKIFLNTADCTYSDIMRSIYMLWDGKLTYHEYPEDPATIYLDYSMFSGSNNRQLLNIPILKPAGVRIRFQAYGEFGATLYAGGSTAQLSKLLYIQDESAEIPMYLVDDEWNVLTDEVWNILYETKEVIA